MPAWRGGFQELEMRLLPDRWSLRDVLEKMGKSRKPGALIGLLGTRD